MKYSMFKCISIKMENISNKTNNNIRKKWLNVILVAQFMSHFIKSHSKIKLKHENALTIQKLIVLSKKIQCKNAWK